MYLLSLLYKFTRFSIYFLFLSDEGPMLETLGYTIRIGSTPTFLYFDLYLYSAYAAHFIYFNTIYFSENREHLYLNALKVKTKHCHWIGCYPVAREMF